MATDGILKIDGYGWAAMGLSHTLIRQFLNEATAWIEAHFGKVWHETGDGLIACDFPNIDEAIAAAMAVQRRLFEFNCSHPELPAPMIVRIGLKRGNLTWVEESKRGEDSHAELCEAGHLEKDCPPGRIRISKSAFDASRFNKNAFRPALTPPEKSESKDSLVWTERFVTATEGDQVERLAQRQRPCYPLIATSPAELKSCSNDASFLKISDVLKEALVVIGETRHSMPEQSPVSHLAATSDAIGMVEIFGALQASPNIVAAIDEWADSEDLITHKHVVIVGSPAVNVYAYAINSVTEAGFVQENDGLLRIRVPAAGDYKHFPETVEHSTFDRHYALVLLTRSAFNRKLKMLWIAGISGMATQAAARFVRDLVLNSTNTINLAGYDAKNKYSMAVVAPAWQVGWKPEDYQGKWRVRDYRIVWLG